VLNDPVDALLDLLAYSLEPGGTDARVCFWLEPHGYALDASLINGTSPKSARQFALRVFFDNAFVPPMHGYAMQHRFEGCVAGDILTDGLRDGLGRLLQGPDASTLDEWRNDRTCQMYRARFDALQPGKAEEIRFYSVGDEFGEFSNFAPYPIKLDGKRWPTSEHYFQAHKFLDAAVRERIRRTASPMEAAKLGRSRKLRLRSDWEAVKVSIMQKAVQAKFDQHADLAALLLGTHDARLIEHAPDDAFWGDGGDGSGRNMLGQILMQLRDELRRSGRLAMR